MNKAFILIILALFVLVLAGVYMLHTNDPAYDFNAMLGANIIMALLSFIISYMMKKQMERSPAAFVRGVTASSFIRLMVCLVCVLCYLAIKKQTGIHKPTIYILLGIYAVYTITDSWYLSRQARTTK